MLHSVALLALLFAAGCGAQEADVPVAAAATAEAPTAAAAEATLVDTAQGLRDAIRAGAPHIVITEHLDLSQAPPDDKTSNFLSSSSAGTPSDETVSIRVRSARLRVSHSSWAHVRRRASPLNRCRAAQGACDAPPPPQLLRPSDAPLRPGQCVLSAPKHRVFFWSYKPKPLWLDNLYVRAAPAGSRKSVLSMGVLEMVDALWLSRVTFQDVSPPGGPALDRSPYAVLHLANCTQVLVQGARRVARGPHARATPVDTACAQPRSPCLQFDARAILSVSALLQQTLPQPAPALQTALSKASSSPRSTRGTRPSCPLCTAPFCASPRPPTARSS